MTLLPRGGARRGAAPRREAARCPPPTARSWPGGFGGVLLAVGLSAGAVGGSTRDRVAREPGLRCPRGRPHLSSLHPLVALETLLPGLFTSLPLKSAWRAAFFESREPVLASLYLGVGALALVAAAAAASHHPLRGLLLGVLALSLLVALGPHTPAYDIVTTLGACRSGCCATL